MDGVIIDSEPMHYQVNYEIFNELNIDVTNEEYRTYIGTSNSEMWSMIKKRHNLTQTVDSLASWQQKKNMKHIIQGEVKLVSGVFNIISSLAEKNYKLALASSSPLEMINKVLDIFSLFKYFTVVSSGEHVEQGKPAPDLFLQVAGKLAISPRNIVVIEDSKNGIIAARRANMKCIGYNNTNSIGQDLDESNFVIEDFFNLTVESIMQLF